MRRVSDSKAAVVILRGVGAVVGSYQYDMVVTVAVSLQHLIDAQHVGLVAVVAPPVAALHQYGVLTGEVGIGDGGDSLFVSAVEQFLGILHDVVPRSQRLRCLGIAFGAIIALMIQMAFVDDPVDVGGVQSSRVALAVELHRATSTFESQQQPLFERREIELHTCLTPSENLLQYVDIFKLLLVAGISLCW